MKKLLHIFVYSMLLLVMVATSCTSKIEVLDYGFMPKIEVTSQSTPYPKSNIPIRLSIKGSNAIISEDMIVTLISQEGEGVLQHATKSIIMGDKITHKFENVLNLSYTPSAAGKVTLTFSFEFDGLRQEETVEIDVKPAAYYLNYINKPDSVFIGKLNVVNFAVSETPEAAKTKAPKSGKYTITAEMTKGNGILLVKNKVLISGLANFELKGTKTKADLPEVELTKDEITSLSYTSLSEGDNKFTTYLTDEFGNIVTSETNFVSTAPPVLLSTTIKKDSIYPAGAICDFYLTLKAETAVDNEYKMNWSFDKDSKNTELIVFNSEGQKLPAGSEVSVSSTLTNKFFFSSTNEQPAFVAWSVTDKYGTKTVKVDTISIKSGDVAYNFDLENQTLQTYVPHKFVGTLSAPQTTTNKYTFSYSISGSNIDARRLSFKIDGKNYTPGTMVDIKSGQQQYEVRIDSAGVYKLKIHIEDSYKKSYDKEVTLTSVTSSLKITNTDIANINYGNSGSMTVTVPSFETHVDNYSAVLAFEPGSGAAITVNGQTITPTVEFPLKKGSNVWVITPNKVNKECVFTVIYKTNLGQEERKRIVIPITLPTMSATVENTKAEVDLTESLLYNLIVTEPNYTEEISVTVNYITGSGTLFIAGKSVPNEGIAKLAKPGITLVSFKPTSIGPVRIELRVADKFDQSKIVYIEGNVLQPPFAATLSSQTTDLKYLTSTPATLSISQALFTGDYEVIASSSKGGTLKVAGQARTWGTTFQLKNGTHNIEFTPNTCGENILNFIVKDNAHNGVVREASITYNVTPYPLSVAVASQSATEVARGESLTFGISIDENLAPNTPYLLSYSLASGNGSVKMGSDVLTPGANKTLTKGTHTFTYTPTASGVNKLDILVKDMFNQTQTVSVNVDVTHNPLEVNCTPAASTYINNAVNISLTASEDKYAGAYHLKYTTDKVGVLKKDGVIVPANSLITIGTTNTLSYTPSLIGAHNLSFEVTDDFGQKKVVKSVITSTIAPIVATPSVSSLNTIVTNATSFTFTPSESGYTGKFFASYKGGTGVLSMNGTMILPDARVEIKSGVNTVSFTPTTTGTHPLNFNITDEHSQSTSFTVAVESSYSSMAFSSAFNASAVYVNRPVGVNLSLSGRVPYSVQYSGGSGTLVRNGVTVAPNTNVSISTNETWQYTSTTTGNHTLNFTATDKDGQTKTSSSSITSSIAAVSANLTTNNNTTLVTKPTSTVLQLSNAAGESPLRVDWNCPQGGSMNIVSGQKYAAGNLTLTYTPNATAGAKTINITVTDDYGQSQSVAWNVTAQYGSIVASMPAVSTLITTPVTVNYTVSKEQYFGTFYVRLSASGGHSLSQSTMNVAAGTHSFVFTPTSDNAASVTLDITDDQGGSTQVTQNITINHPRLDVNVVFDTNSPSNGFSAYICTIDTRDYPAGSDFTCTLERKDPGLQVSINRRAANQFEVVLNDPGSAISGAAARLKFEDRYGATWYETVNLVDIP